MNKATSILTFVAPFCSTMSHLCHTSFALSITIMKIYCISGLGADERAFQFLDLQPHQFVYLDWIKPLVGETLPDYAQRMGQRIDTSEPYALMGFSFGGMLSVEIAKTHKPHKLFLVSSILGEKDVPALHRFAGNIKLHQLLPDNLLTSANILTMMAFGLETPASEKLLKEILQEADPFFFRWALESILRWKNQDVPEHVRIHGTKDRILPVDTAQVQYVLKGGGHFAIVDRADEISSIIKQELS